MEVEKIQCLILKAFILLLLGKIQEPISILKNIEEKGELNKLTKTKIMEFYKTKRVLN